MIIDKIAICQRRIHNPLFTLQRIGDEFGCTREYVRQILKSNKLQTKSKRRFKVTCLNCGNEFSIWYCNLHRRNGKFCSRVCYWSWCRTTIICKICGKAFTVRNSDIRGRLKKGQSPPRFCSKRCQGKWLAKTAGFEVHPENRLQKGIGLKWNWDKVMELQKQTGWGSNRLGKTLGIPYSTVSNILRKRRK